MENAGERLIDAAQALLTGYDTTLSRQWREEERAWRQQDMQWRDQERYYAELDARFMQQERDWRKADLKQRHLENAHVLWTRSARKSALHKSNHRSTHA
jgi:calcium release-activated calcium channel protein 1